MHLVCRYQRHTATLIHKNRVDSYIKKCYNAITMNFRQTLFWDVDPVTIDPDKNARYIIERILDLGNEKEVRWVASQYPISLIRDVINQSRTLHDKSRALWSRVFQ